MCLEYALRRYYSGEDKTRIEHIVHSPKERWPIHPERLAFSFYALLSLSLSLPYSLPLSVLGSF